MNSRFYDDSFDLGKAIREINSKVLERLEMERMQEELMKKEDMFYNKIQPDILEPIKSIKPQIDFGPLHKTLDFQRKFEKPFPQRDVLPQDRFPGPGMPEPMPRPGVDMRPLHNMLDMQKKVY